MPEVHMLAGLNTFLRISKNKGDTYGIKRFTAEILDVKSIKY